MYYLEKNIENLDRIFDQNSREGYLRLDLNQNPEGLPQDFINKVLKDITPEFVAKYPETLEFTQILAGYLHTDIDHICLTNGSSEGIRQIIEAFTSPGLLLNTTTLSPIDTASAISWVTRMAVLFCSLIILYISLLTSSLVL